MNLKTNILPSKFFMMIILSITAACVLVVISMALYSYSGAAQLDLSRPDYQILSKNLIKCLIKNSRLSVTIRIVLIVHL